MSWDYDEQEVEGVGDGIRITPGDATVNHLLLIWAIEYDPHNPTQYSRPDKPSDMIVVDVVDLDQVDPETGEEGLLARHCWWRPARLIKALRPRIGKPAPLLAYLTRGIATMGKPPYELLPAHSDAGCRARADAWRDRNPGFRPSLPRAESVATTQADTPRQNTPSPRQATPTQSAVIERLRGQGQQGSATLLEQLARSRQATSGLQRPPQEDNPPF